MDNYPVLLVVSPLMAALFCGIILWINEKLCFPVALAGLAISLFSAVKTLMAVLSNGTVQYKLAGWSPPIGIEYRIDLLNGVVLVLVSAIALVNLVASLPSIHQEMPDRSGMFITVYMLFVTGLMGVTVTGDLFNLYVLLEITSLTSYTQIGLGDRNRGPLASLNYVFIGVIGASFYLLGVGYLYIKTGSLNMADVANIIAATPHSTTVLVAFILCMIGVWVKMALFPLHVWLPNAYTYAPTAVSRVIAPLMTKVMVYVMIRLMVTVFGYDYIFVNLHLSNAVVWLATAAVIFGAVMAISQKDLKKMLTYIIVCEIGYMVGGAWLGNKLGMTGAILHIINDALMTFALFLAVGNMVYKNGSVRFTNLSGMFCRMPWTMGCFVVAAFSIIGVPPTCCFFSKWYLILGAFQAGAYQFAAALLISSLICAVLFFRIFEIGFFPTGGGGGHHHEPVVMAEAPAVMLIPLGLVTASLFVVGMYSGTIVNSIITPFLQ
ncbi:MAG: proton-conducting transporter membrane subunit [Pseudomonadota bacterium]